MKFLRDTTAYRKIADSFEEQGALLMVGIDGSYGTFAFETQRDLHKQFLAWVSADPRLSGELGVVTINTETNGLVGGGGGCAVLAVYALAGSAAW